MTFTRKYPQPGYLKTPLRIDKSVKSVKTVISWCVKTSFTRNLPHVSAPFPRGFQALSRKSVKHRKTPFDQNWIQAAVINKTWKLAWIRAFMKSFTYGALAPEGL